MGRTVGLLGLASVFALCACDAAPDIHLRMYRTPRAEADYRVVTVLRGRRVHPVVETHFDPPFSTKPAALALSSFDVEMRLAPAGPLPEYEAVCFDVQRRGAWPDRVSTARICTRFVKGEHLRQDVYFNWWPPCFFGGGSSEVSPEGAPVECPLPAPGCRLLRQEERERLERMTPAPAAGGRDEVHDTSWGDPPESSRSLGGSVESESIQMAAVCAFECPSQTQTQPRPPPDASVSRADAAVDAGTDARPDAGVDASADVIEEDTVIDAPEERPRVNYCPADAAADAADEDGDADAGCVPVPP